MNIQLLNYVIKTIASAAHLLESCDDAQQTDAIMARMTAMLTRAWTAEYKLLKRSIPAEVLLVGTKQFWDDVSHELVCTVERACYQFQAIFGPEVNPPGTEGRVDIVFQASRSVHSYCATLNIDKDEPSTSQIRADRATTT